MHTLKYTPNRPNKYKVELIVDTNSNAYKLGQIYRRRGAHVECMPYANCYQYGVENWLAGYYSVDPPSNPQPEIALLLL